MLRMEVLGSGMMQSNPISGRPMGSPFTIDDCLHLGVDGVMTMGIIGNDFDLDNLNYIAGIAAACNKYGLISAAEMLPNGFSSKPEDRNLKVMNIACRVGAEIGVDIVKTEFVKPIEDFKKIVANSFVDILALGGAKVADDRLVLENAHQAMEAGCKGLIIGRNVWGHKNITGMAAALCQIVHENKTVDEALKALD
jgi:class I fructose-bisphosphate aldolase